MADRPFTSSEADFRLKAYLGEGNVQWAGTLHRSRSGCAINHTLLGTKLQDVMQLFLHPCISHCLIFIIMCIVGTLNILVLKVAIFISWGQADNGKTFF